VLVEFDLDKHERAILREACRTADAIDLVQEEVDADGPMSESSQGVRVHPALVELRQQRLAFARLVTALRIPSDSEAQQPRTQRRGPFRGVYGIAGGAS